MYALLNDNDELVNGEPVQIFRKPKAETINGIQYPRNWWTAYSQAEKAAMHVFPIARPPVNADPQQQESGNFTYSFDGTQVLESPELMPVTLPAYKRTKISELEAKRDGELSLPVFVTFGQTEYAFTSTGAAKELMMEVRTAMNAGFTLPATFTWSSIDWPDNVNPTHEQTVSVINESQFNDIIRTVILRDYQTNKKFVELREAVDEALTLAEVDLITW